jgi:dTDP-4-dehydrorhamnose 3,5-epimerase
VPPGGAAIAGVQVIPLRPIADHRGAVYPMMKETDPHFLRFGEIYFSTVYPGVVKAWKSHRRITVNFACISGRIKLVLYDGRDSSATRGAVMETLLGPDLYSLVVIPPGVWNGFQGLSPPLSIVANCATGPNDPAEFERQDPACDRIPYRW